MLTAARCYRHAADKSFTELMAELPYLSSTFVNTRCRRQHRIRIVDCRRGDDRSNQTNRIGSVLTTLRRRCVMEGRPMDEPPFLDTDLG